MVFIIYQKELKIYIKGYTKLNVAHTLLRSSLSAEARRAIVSPQPSKMTSLPYKTLNQKLFPIFFNDHHQDKNQTITGIVKIQIKLASHSLNTN